MTFPKANFKEVSRGEGRAYLIELDYPGAPRDCLIRFSTSAEWVQIGDGARIPCKGNCVSLVKIDGEVIAVWVGRFQKEIGGGAYQELSPKQKMEILNEIG